MRAQRDHAGNQAARILRAAQRPSQEESDGSAAQDAPAHDEGLSGNADAHAGANFSRASGGDEKQGRGPHLDAEDADLGPAQQGDREEKNPRGRRRPRGDSGPAKSRRESIDEYIKANRPDLASKEEAELNVLKVYLPAALTEAELKAMVQAAIQSSGAKSPHDMGRVMSVIMPQIKGRADGKQAQTLVQQALSAVK